ncbi:hypothetical protein LAZ67_6000909, partial [Cordylochernes scorpioides]
MGGRSGERIEEKTVRDNEKDLLAEVRDNEKDLLAEVRDNEKDLLAEVRDNEKDLLAEVRDNKKDALAEVRDNEKDLLAEDSRKHRNVENLINENPRIGLRVIAIETGISKFLVGMIIKDLQLRKTPAKFVPKMLTFEKKNDRENIITGNETWVYEYDPETKRQSIEWKGKDELRTKKSRLCKS